MARTLKTVLTNFSSGELNPLLATRIDTPAYSNGAKQCRNFALLAEGGLMRRPGTTYLATLPAESRLIPFVFSDDEIAIIVLSNQRMDVYNINGSAIVSNYTTNCNWTTAQLFELNFAQFGDTIFITHRDNETRRLFRESATSFTVSVFAFDDDDSVTVSGVNKTTRPFYKYASSSISVSLSSHATGTGRTVTASADAFTSNQVGDYIEINKKQGKITGFTSATEVTITIIEDMGSAGPHFDWAEQSISTKRGFPQAVTFHNNRLWLGGLKSRPAGILASRISEYFNFSVGTGQADEAIDLDIAGSEVNEVRHMLSGKDLQVFTDGGEYYIPRANDNTITPGNVSVLRQTPYGISRTAPVMFDQAAGFVQKNGKAVREFVYSDIEDGYKSTSVSILAEHLIDNPKQVAIIKGNFTRPEQYAFFLNNGSTLPGSMAIFHSVRDEKIAGWGLWTTKENDLYQSVITLNEFLVCIVKRQLNGSTVYTLEKFGDDDSITLDMQTTSTVSQRGTPLVQGASQSGAVVKIDGFTSDPQINETFTIAGNSTEYTIQAVTNNGGGSYDLNLDQNLAATPADNAVVTIVKGYFHSVNGIYTNESVNAVEGNSSLGAFTVSGTDTITLNSPRGTGVKIGFNYTPIIETMPIDKELPEGPLTGLPRRISRAIIDINSALDLTVKAADTTSKSLVVQQVNFTGGSDLTPVTDKKEFFFLGYSKSPTVTLSQDDPLPIKILGMSVEVVFA
tara:strand:+ start:1305 stop:3515 length:2211 start_codon:yes stop_codon:yes gene_type:complete